MRAEELMIGDWVKANGFPLVISEKDLKFYKEHEGEEKYSLKGLPISPDILKRNGFKYDKAKAVYCSELFNLEHIKGNTCIIENTEIRITYVHELQRILKLCGIDKEIEL